MRISEDEIVQSCFSSTIPGCGHRFWSPGRLYLVIFLFLNIFVIFIRYVLPAYMPVHCVHGWCHGDRKRVLEPLELAFQVLWATVWVLEVEPVFSGRSASLWTDEPPPQNSSVFKRSLLCVPGGTGRQTKSNLHTESSLSVFVTLELIMRFANGFPCSLGRSVFRCVCLSISIRGRPTLNVGAPVPSPGIPEKMKREKQTECQFPRSASWPQTEDA